jgi:hypothetical protein
MNREPRGTDAEERAIGERERAFDLARDRVAGLERTIEGLKKTANAPYSHFLRDRLPLQISNAERELAAAREALVEAEQKMREAQAWRSTQPASEGDRV